MKGILIIPFLLILILSVNYWGHINPPASISSTPFVIPIITLACLKISDLKLLVRMLLIVFFIALNDYLIRTYAGGTHDSAGNGWIILMFMIGSIISLVILITCIIKRNLELKKSFFHLLISTSILLTYYSTCRTYGMSWIESASKSIEHSKKSGKYLGQLNVSNNFKTDQAWYEQTVKINHKLPIQSKETTEEITYVIEADSIELNKDRRYIIHAGMTGYNWLNKRITFRTDSNIEEFYLVITDADNIKIALDTVKIKRP